MTQGPTIRRIDDPEEEGPDVRLAENRDVPRIAATLTIALADSRWTRWALPDDGRMQRLTRLHELDAGHRGVATGSTWVTDDVDAVAAWEPPAGTAPLPADVAEALARELPYIAGTRARVVADTAALVGAARPSDAALVAGPPRRPALVPPSRAGRGRARPGGRPLRHPAGGGGRRRLLVGERPLPARLRLRGDRGAAHAPTTSSRCGW